jgi:hypothetical protein
LAIVIPYLEGVFGVARRIGDALKLIAQAVRIGAQSSFFEKWLVSSWRAHERR